MTEVIQARDRVIVDCRAHEDRRDGFRHRLTQPASAGIVAARVLSGPPCRDAATIRPAIKLVPDTEWSSLTFGAAPDSPWAQ